MTTTALRSQTCPRCREKLRRRDDIHGAYLWCIQCGFHSYTSLPAAPRIRSPEALKASYSFFDYAGSNEAFKGLRIRGKLLVPKGQQTTARFDLLCPYAACPKRQLAMDSGAGRKVKPYQCKNKHIIHLDIEAFTWA